MKIDATSRYFSPDNGHLQRKALIQRLVKAGIWKKA